MKKAIISIGVAAAITVAGCSTSSDESTGEDGGVAASPDSGSTDTQPGENFKDYFGYPVAELYFCGRLEGDLPGFSKGTGSWDIGTDTIGLGESKSTGGCPSAISTFTALLADPPSANGGFYTGDITYSVGEASCSTVASTYSRTFYCDPPGPQNRVTMFVHE